ncbi:alpha/beta hydrolase [Actinomadura litoris]|uniref:alpha/beta hydrolase n=1 Tax=Actinomadura litoris TaxID=2678616 RepID=UPI001FA72DAA|nr:alpha/beta hydrolase [Actinomadura litoris]
MANEGHITTGQDLAEATRAENAALKASLAGRPRPHEIGDPVAVRAAGAAGKGAFPAPVLLPQGTNQAVPGRGGDVPVRTFETEDPRGVLMFLHGGGWTLGTAEGQDIYLWDLAQAAHVCVVSVGYRLAPEHPHPAAAEDCEDVARWLLDHAADRFGADRLLIAGESAGAHLAVLTLLRLGADAPAFRAAQLSYGVFDLSMTPSQRDGADKLFTSTPAMRWFYDQYLPGLAPEERRDPAISPLYADVRGMPPARFTVGTEDPLLDDSLFMAARWRAAGNDTELEVVAEGIHGFASFPLTIARREIDRQSGYLARAVADR